MNKKKNRLNNSASLGKTVARHSYPHSQSFFAQPSETYAANRETNNYESHLISKLISTPKLLTHLRESKVQNLTGMMDNVSRIKDNKKQCQLMEADLEQSLMEKSIRINKLFHEMNYFAMCVEELKWLLKEGNKLIQNHFKQTKLVTPQSAHTRDAFDLLQEFKSLVLRFQNIQKGNIHNRGLFFKQQTQIRHVKYDTLPFSTIQQVKSRFDEQGQPSFQTTQLRKQKDTRENSAVNVRKMGLSKENINNSNIASHFENIKISHPKETKTQDHTQLQFARFKEENYRKMNEVLEKNNELKRQIQMLRGQIKLKQRQVNKNIETSNKMVQNFSLTLKRIANTLKSNNKTKQIFKIGQYDYNREQMFEHFGQMQKTNNLDQSKWNQYLRQIKNLQYEITNVLDSYPISKQKEMQQHRKRQKYYEAQQYRMILIQALTIEEVCNE